MVIRPTIEMVWAYFWPRGFRTIAARYRKIKALKILIECGADPMKMSNGATRALDLITDNRLYESDRISSACSTSTAPTL
jgi:hypothetical protein